MEIPQLPPLQCMILQLVKNKECSGVEIRRWFGMVRLMKKGPAFYQIMGRMEKTSLITSRKQKSMDGKQIIRECVYKITVLGEKRLRETIEFYSKLSNIRIET